MNRVAFTIVAKNYIGLAKILRDSFIEKNPECHFMVFVADEYESDEPDVVEAKNILNLSTEEWLDMSFKYTLTEFCTAIKPFCFSYLFNTLGYTAALYLDPDIYIFDSLHDVYSMLEVKSFYLTPHIVTPETSINDDRICLQSGIFNLGFIGLSASNSTSIFLKWWESRLKNNCYDDLISYTFTDQKWANFIPAFFPSDVYISTALGMNLAPWNYFERLVVKKEDKFFVKNRLLKESNQFPLLFVHYSGFNYKELLDGQISRNRTRKVTVYSDISSLLDYYKNQLLLNVDSFRQYIDLPYTYGFFDNGEKIDKIHRRIYRQLSENNKNIDSPFSANGELFRAFRKRKMLTTENVNNLSQGSVSSLDSKTSILCRFMLFVFKLIGYKRYLQLLKFMKYFSRLESQAFLVDSSMHSHIVQ